MSINCNDHKTLSLVDSERTISAKQARKHLRRPVQRQSARAQLRQCRKGHENGDDAHRRCAEDSCGCHSRSQARVLGLVASTLPLVASRPALAEVEAAVSKYTPSPYTPGWEIWFGAVAAAVPFVIGSWEFGKRILIQQRCVRCAGSGLVLGANSKRYRKCPDCGGFFPWQGWGKFFTSTAAPGNGGPLRQPKGQTSVFYKVPEALKKEPVATRSSDLTAEERDS